MKPEVKEIVDGIVPVLEEKIEEKIEAGMKDMKDSQGKDAETMKALADDVAEMKTASKKIAGSNDTAGNEKLAKQAIVNIFKNVHTQGISTEAQFEKSFQAIIKETFQNTGETGNEVDNEGSDFVFDQFETGVHAIFEQYPLVNELNTLKLAKGKSITLPTYDGGVEAYWIDEGSNFTPSKAGTGTIKTDIYKLGALVTFTDEMLEDDMTTETLYSLIMKDIGTKFAQKLENDLLNGAQTGKLKGILTNTDVLNHDSTATTVAALSDVDFSTADGLIDEKYDINPNNKIAVMKKTTKNALMTVRDANGALIFPEVKATNEIFGHRIITARSMPTASTGNVAVLMGNIKDFYRHVSRKGFTAEMGHATGDFQAGKKSVRAERRDGGQLIEAEAFVTITLG